MEERRRDEKKTKIKTRDTEEEKEEGKLVVKRRAWGETRKKNQKRAEVDQENAEEGKGRKKTSTTMWGRKDKIWYGRRTKRREAGRGNVKKERRNITKRGSIKEYEQGMNRGVTKTNFRKRYEKR